MKDENKDSFLSKEVLLLKVQCSMQRSGHRWHPEYIVCAG
jgi:hypothetical protein